MAMKLEKENVRFILMEILAECDLYGREGKEAEVMCHYISGALDMAKAVIEAIGELGA
jgi:hypothetical protein